MPKAKNEKANNALELYKQGLKLVDIAKQLDLPEGTVRRWKHTYDWDGKNPNVRKEKTERSLKKVYAKTAEQVIEVCSNNQLNDRRRMFCLNYVQSFNATKAYMKAYGCSYETAAVKGCNLLKRQEIRDEINLLKQNRMNMELVSEEDIFQKYLDIAFNDITDFLEFGREEVPVMGPFGPIVVEDEDTGEKMELKKEINSVKFRDSSRVDGTLISEVKVGKDGASIKLHDRMKALDWLANHMDFATEEQKARVRLLNAQVQKLNTENDSAKKMDGGVVIVSDIPRNE